MNSIFIRPKKQEVEFKGKLSYGESVRAWNTIRLKKEFINEFSDLRDRDSKVNYIISFKRTFTELEKLIKKMKKLNTPVPCLLLFEKIK